MTEDFLDVFEGNPGCQHLGGGGVAQLVQADVLDAAVPGDGFKILAVFVNMRMVKHVSDITTYLASLKVHRCLQYM